MAWGSNGKMYEGEKKLQTFNIVNDQIWDRANPGLKEKNPNTGSNHSPDAIKLLN